MYGQNYAKLSKTMQDYARCEQGELGLPQARGDGELTSKLARAFAPGSCRLGAPISPSWTPKGGEVLAAVCRGELLLLVQTFDAKSKPRELLPTLQPKLSARDQPKLENEQICQDSCEHHSTIKTCCSTMVQPTLREEGPVMHSRHEWPAIVRILHACRHGWCWAEHHSWCHCHPSHLQEAAGQAVHHTQGVPPQEQLLTSPAAHQYCPCP